MPCFDLEDQCTGLVCGIDEVGRGPLAGPVVAAAVVLNRQTLPTDLLKTINDSKKLNALRRAEIFSGLADYAHIGIGQACAEEIDEINILNATLLAMQRAVEALDLSCDMALVDGNKCPDLPFRSQAVIKGDAYSYSIAAASIIAKHHRDCLMALAAQDYPAYGWDRNSGYGTVLHLKALSELGLSPWHRRSFTARYQETATTN